MGDHRVTPGQWLAFFGMVAIFAIGRVIDVRAADLSQINAKFDKQGQQIAILTTEVTRLVTKLDDLVSAIDNGQKIPQ